eukprot:TRINITY_DN22914_c0_g1_i3.p2 TRINITY_DN22914_c0_g1~~TRINITY_DN22914_c0_g1_i3.p2  ORF type:complete len:140 (+),score=46.39 TRINITY_DN22914_c0_g1_i3:131-550(+)
MQRGLVGSEMCIRDRSTWERELLKECCSELPKFSPYHSPKPFRSEYRSPLQFGQPNLENTNKASTQVKNSLEGIQKDLTAFRKGVSSVYQAVSYTHLTLPTILLVQISVVAVSLKKKNEKNHSEYKKKKKEQTKQKGRR